MNELLLALLIFPQIEIDVTHSTYTSERVMSEWGAQIRAGKDFYLVGTYEMPKFTLIGQGYNMDILGYGAGYRKCKDKICGFGEVLYHKPVISVNKFVRDESVWTKLKNDHGVPDWEPEHTTYRLDSGYGSRIGLSYEHKNMTFSLSYRSLSFDERIDACTGEDSRCKFPVDGNHWQNGNTLKLNSMEFGIGVRF